MSTHNMFLSFLKQAYSNILKILPPKNENFQIKNSDVFHISAQNIDCGYLLELQSLTNPLPSCPGQVRILAGQVIFLFHLPRKMCKIYREYCNFGPVSRCCGIPDKWLKLGFVRPWNCLDEVVLTSTHNLCFEQK